ncbi:zinc-dependent alcohol dehydrogenase family protein [Nocardia terpenica]|uniref:Alcohol dehydrogenase n=1 Tax=Nocardia terpenica TaxID=455432 RepID=A0A164NJY9_9NOCA|nr:zinc-dependent alcohol dehydrogenase family protein [Nocardia terpenica]KZM74444.1 alcohol dehydrogenase [Nocardia terpenica]MBF6059829.1 zinc-dependent alcohol dehydrogenase family protein [Nocardia terpenica]MBF6102630.1 zinc-dependent alcohol dehydrogenase family protein [Nocardia terpenica]MBF6111179.1 zinc-dependent alcohol dehydrogenase family protein [Nocardia terpenica]MBF6117310.1 zinc-dependent alcohol dehydrogenase family protein [Nocardia terpenica]
MRAVVIQTPGSYSVETVDDPTPEPDEVVVAVAAVGICGTDIHIVDGEFAPTPYPIIPGHEFTGEVVACGSGVTGVVVGDRVAVDPSLFCGACHYCSIGRGNLCERWGAVGDTVNGAMAEYVSVPAANCHRLPDSVDLAEGTLIEPLSCAVHGFDMLPRDLGAHYLIYGAGTMGLMMLQLALRAGAASVSMVDLNSDRLAVARKLGAAGVACAADDFDRAQGWEIVIDCTGAIPAIEDGLTRVRRGGTFQQFGVSATRAQARFSPFRVYNDEITIVGSMAVVHSFGRAVELMGAGVLDANTMITHSFPLAEFGQALQTFRDGVGRKIQIHPGA